jgi:hypothetical protein
VRTSVRVKLQVEPALLAENPRENSWPGYFFFPLPDFFLPFLAFLSFFPFLDFFLNKFSRGYPG